MAGCTCAKKFVAVLSNLSSLSQVCNNLWITDAFNSNSSTCYQLSNTFELKNANKDPELQLCLSKAKSLFETTSEQLITKILNAKYDKSLVKTINVPEKNSSNQNIVFMLQTDEFVKETLTQNIDKAPPKSAEQKRFIVEYSSPNIAKPFHVGHLRSTIIGNFIANLHKYIGHHVHRINYLGDWGTQFGLLNVGIELKQLSDDEIKKNPIQSLYEAYIEANRQAALDPAISERARQYFYELETGESPENRNRWKKYREYAIIELSEVYNRLGVEFDEYAWESQYNQKDIRQVIEELDAKRLLFNEIDGRRIVQVGDRRVPIIKSDGSTLYLARDIAAIFDRFERFNFDRMFYVVDNAQTDHFVACFRTAAKARPELNRRLQHLKFGRIKGMSTRQGTAIFLKDVLDEACEVMKQKQLKSPTTKVELNSSNNRISDVLGISAVIVNDLKQRCQRDYDFDWSRALQSNGDTGIKLQYTHCRLNSLFENNVTQAASEVDSNSLKEPEAINLIIEIARFPEIIRRCEEHLEACILVNYLFTLSNAISRALKRLNIKNENSLQLRQQRMLLFSHAYRVLHDGMKILGLKPLDKM